MDNLVLLGLFLEGILSFLSPCILPLVPLYIGYITSNAKKDDRFSVMLNTNAFVLGICTVFFVMGLGVNYFKGFFEEYQNYITLIGAVFLIVMGLINIGLLKRFNLKKAFKFQFKPLKKKGLLNAYLLGFFFSFAWTPCVGPYLTNALLLASSASDSLIGNIFILAYALGFVIPFLVIGIFTDTCLKLIKNNMNILNLTVKVGGVVMLLMGIYMGYDAINKINSSETNKTNESAETVQALDFSLMDQNGNLHNLSDYEDEVIVIQFVASWCKYCEDNYPNMIELQKQTDVPVLLMVAPGLGNELAKDELIQYYQDLNVDLPILFDEDYRQAYFYGISGYPTNLIIDKKGNIFGLQAGILPTDLLIELVNELKLQ